MQHCKERDSKSVRLKTQEIQSVNERKRVEKEKLQTAHVYEEV